MTSFPSLARAAELLGGEVRGDQILCPGPGHSKADRSLSVRRSQDDREGFVVNSFANDSSKACREHVREKLGLEPFDEKRKSNGKANAGSATWKLIREHIYYRADGTPHLRKRKMLDPNGKRQFPQWHWAGGKWVSGLPKNWSPL